jgi:hypothetical protein
MHVEAASFHQSKPAMSHIGTSRTWRGVRLESVVRAKADIDRIAPKDQSAIFKPEIRSAASEAAPLCPGRHPPQSVAACLSRAARRILSRMGTKSRETIYGSSVRAASERAKEARKEADRLACEAWNKRMLGFQDRLSHRRRWAMHSMPGAAILKFGALAVTRIRPFPSTSCGDRRRHRSMNSNVTCDAASVPKFGAIPTSAAI